MNQGFDKGWWDDPSFYQRAGWSLLLQRDDAFDTRATDELYRRLKRIILRQTRMVRAKHRGADLDEMSFAALQFDLVGLVRNELYCPDWTPAELRDNGTPRSPWVDRALLARIDGMIPDEEVVLSPDAARSHLDRWAQDRLTRLCDGGFAVDERVDLPRGSHPFEDESPDDHLARVANEQLLDRGPEQTDLLDERIDAAWREVRRSYGGERHDVPRGYPVRHDARPGPAVLAKGLLVFNRCRDTARASWLKRFEEDCAADGPHVATMRLLERVELTLRESPDLSREHAALAYAIEEIWWWRLAGVDPVRWRPILSPDPSAEAAVVTDRVAAWSLWHFGLQPGDDDIKKQAVFAIAHNWGFRFKPNSVGPWIFQRMAPVMNPLLGVASRCGLGLPAFPPTPERRTP